MKSGGGIQINFLWVFEKVKMSSMPASLKWFTCLSECVCASVTRKYAVRDQGQECDRGRETETQTGREVSTADYPLSQPVRVSQRLSQQG